MADNPIPTSIPPVIPTPVSPVAPPAPLPESVQTASQKITTTQENVQTAGGGTKVSLSQATETSTSKKRLNLISEVVQASIAVLVTIGVVLTIVLKIESQVLTNSFFVILGYYFGRTVAKNGTTSPTS